VSASDSGELSYDSLFACASEAVLVMDAHTECVVEANPAAALLLRTDRTGLLRLPFSAAFEERSVQDVQRSLIEARATGRGRAIGVGSRHGRALLGLEVSLFRSGPECYLLVRLSSRSTRNHDTGSGLRVSTVLRTIERAAVGFLITDAALRVEYANRAFLQMLKVRSAEQVRGQSLAHWLELSGENLAGLRRQMAQRQAATHLRTTLQRRPHRSACVEVQAVAVHNGRNTRWGFTLSERPPLH
jgi:nitrogen-specific signal transduction histidine kinase